VSDIVLGADLPPEILNSYEAYVGCVAGAIREEEYLEAMRQAGFADVRVTSRFVYGEEHVQGFFGSAETGGCGCGCSAIPQDAAGTVRQIAGKVWSAQISAVKPKA
jgi:hypothetical protein